MVQARSARETAELLDSGTPVALLDIRDPLDYTRGHIRACTPVPRGELETRLPELVPNPKTPVVLCDRQGDRAEADCRWLSRLGYTDVSYLDGGIEAWKQAGYELIESVDDVYSTAFNYDSKAFGERVEERSDLPKLTPEELERKLASDDTLVVDVRTPEEYDELKTIPGAMNVEGVDVALYLDALRRPDQDVVINCAGRTRSIIGTATLRTLGFENVYELENGTMGWQLAGFDLDDGRGRPSTDQRVDEARYEQLRRSAGRLLDESDAARLSPDGLDALKDRVDPTQSVYLLDVRTHDEFRNGHVPGSHSSPGGQLIQTTDQQIAVRAGEIVLISETDVRASITAYWLSEMGLSNVSVLEGGIAAWKDADRPVEDGDGSVEAVGSDVLAEYADYTSPVELSALVDDAAVTVVDVGDSARYEDGHVPGAVWVPRYELEHALGADVPLDDPVVLTCEDGTVSEFAVAQLRAEREIETVSALRGGVAAWRDAGFDVETGNDGWLFEPRTAAEKPYQQSKRAMETYLEWEENMLEN